MPPAWMWGSASSSVTASASAPLLSPSRSTCCAGACWGSAVRHLPQPGDSLSKYLRCGEQAENQVSLGLEIVEEAGLYQNVVAGQEFQHPLFLAAHLRRLHRDVPAAFHRQDTRRPA